MRRLLLLVTCGTLLLSAITVHAQTNTPTPTTGPWIFATLSFEQISSPTPIPSATPILMQGTADIPTGPIYDGLATVEGNLQNAPDQVAPAGWLPNETGYQLFSYIKWTFSSSVGDELAGPFGPLLGRLAAIIGIEIILAGIYFIFFVVRLVLRFVQWILTLILKFIPFFG
jgi:hypothetical protein